MKAVIAKRYPCAALPTGALTDLAAEFGVSRERIRQIAKEMGLHGTSGKRAKWTRLFCAECGKRITKPLEYFQARGVEPPTFCGPCSARPIPVECSACGKVVLKRRAVFERGVGISRTVDKRYGARFFCSRPCMGRWAGKAYGWGSPDHPIHHQGDEAPAATCAAEGGSR